MNIFTNIKKEKIEPDKSQDNGGGATDAVVANGSTEV
jgi:hypothetical protein